MIDRKVESKGVLSSNEIGSGVYTATLSDSEAEPRFTVVDSLTPPRMRTGDERFPNTSSALKLPTTRVILPEVESGSYRPLSMLSSRPLP